MAAPPLRGLNDKIWKGAICYAKGKGPVLASSFSFVCASLAKGKGLVAPSLLSPFAPFPARVAACALLAEENELAPAWPSVAAASLKLQLAAL